MEDGSDDGGKENPKPLLRPSILDDDPELDALLDGNSLELNLRNE